MSPTTTCAKRFGQLRRQLFTSSENENEGASEFDQSLLDHENQLRMICNGDIGYETKVYENLVPSEEAMSPKIIEEAGSQRPERKERVNSRFGFCCMNGSFTWLERHLDKRQVNMILITLLLLFVYVISVIHLGFVDEKYSNSYKNKLGSSISLSETLVDKERCTAHRYISTYKDGIVPETTSLHLPMLPPTALWNVDASHNLLMCSMSKVESM